VGSPHTRATAKRSARRTTAERAFGGDGCNNLKCRHCPRVGSVQHRSDVRSYPCSHRSVPTRSILFHVYCQRLSPTQREPCIVITLKSSFLTILFPSASRTKVTDLPSHDSPARPRCHILWRPPSSLHSARCTVPTLYSDEYGETHGVSTTDWLPNDLLAQSATRLEFSLCFQVSKPVGGFFRILLRSTRR
jgi:hypothetical protein